MKRKIYKLLSGAKQGIFALALTIFWGTACSQTFIYTGSTQTISLPAGNYSIECWGADGGSATNGTNLLAGGKGGYSRGIYTNPSTATINVYVGGRGGNASGAPQVGSGGGGMSDIAAASNTNIVIISAGGGGGSTSGGTTNENSTGGDAGGLTGASAIDGTGVTGGSAATGGSQTTGGSATAGTYGVGSAGGFGYGGGGANGGVAGAMHSAGGAGGNGGTGGWNGGGGGCTLTGINDHAAGGGAGYYGGGGGRGDGGAGGGGSGYIGGVTGGATIMFGQTGFVTNPDVTGNGRIIITSLCNLSMVNSAGPGPICSGGSATLSSDGISSYSWSTGATTGTIVVSPTVTTQYTLTAMTPQSCTTSAVITVSVINSPPTVTAVTTSSSICAGGAVILTASGAATYTWTNGVTNAVSYTPTATNIYTVTGQNACGLNTAMVGVTVNTSPITQALVSNSVVCNGSSVTFTSSGNATSYVWSSGIVSGTPYFPTATANYTLIGSSNGCSSVSVVGVTVLVTPTVSPVVTPTAICLGATATLSAVGANGYTWSPGTNPNTSTITVSPPITTNYTVVRSNGICSSTMAVNLVVNPLPLVVPSATPSQICAGSGVNLVVVGPISNTWMPGGFTSANFTLFPNSSTCYTVTGSNGNCTATTAICVTVNPNPPITINAPISTICEGQSVILTTGGALTYTWLASGSNNLTETVSPPATTLITVSGSNSFGCTASASQLILVNAAPNMSLTNSVPYLCVGNTAVLSIANPSPNVSYSWSNGPTGVSNPVTPTITTSYTVTGINNITSCSASNSITVAVYISTFVVNAPSAICKGQTATLSVSGAATSYSWNINGGIIAPSVTVAPVLNATYNVTGINGNCESNIAITLTVNPLPNVTAVVTKPFICKYEVATISGGGANTYTWNTNSNNAVLSFTLDVTTTYTLTGTDTKGCSKTTTVTQFVATCIGIQDLEENGAGINIYPNPNNGTFMIRSDENITLDIINTLGQVITTIKLSDRNVKEVTVDNVPTGIYFIRSQTDGLKINKKLIIER